MAVINITVDSSDLMEKLNFIKNNCTEARCRQAMFTIFNRTGKHVKTILRKDIPQKYEVPAGEVGGTVGAAQVSGMSCIIPIRGPRRGIGDKYKASGGARGWESLRKKYRVKARIVKGRTSTLPEKWHSGYPPFRNTSFSSVAFARSSGARGPIMKITGIAIPQMPMNLAEPAVQADIKTWLEKQVDDRIRAMLLGYA